MEVQECEQTASAEGFGVSVELSAVFADERARCWVWVEAGRPARWLLARVLAALGPPPAPAAAPRPLALLAPRGLLLPDDPLALLRHSDTVRVVPVDFDLYNTVGKHNLQLEQQFDSRDFCDGIEISGPRSGGGQPPLPAPAPPPPPALQEMKQRALELLEQYAGAPSPLPAADSPPPAAASPPAPVSPPPARARRRRVRRRRRPADSDTADGADGGPPAKIPTAEPRSQSPAQEPRAPEQPAAAPSPASPGPPAPPAPPSRHPERAECGRGEGGRGGPPPRLVRAL